MSSAFAFNNDALLSRFLMDEGVLLRCATTYDWDELVRRCDLCTDLFSSSTRDADSRSHQQLVASARRQLQQRDDWGNTPLHLSCYHRAPLAVIEALLNAASNATPEPVAITSFRTKDDSTPLLIACATGVEPAIIEALLNPPGDCMPGGELARWPDSQGSTPLSELCTNYELERKQRRHASNSPPLSDINLVTMDDSELFAAFFRKVQALVRASWRTTSSFPYISILHGVAAMPQSCPPVLTQLLCRCYPHMVSSTDRRGVLPLHLVVSSTITSHGSNNKNNNVLLTNQCYMFQTLLQLYPQASTMPSPLHTHRSIFCQAILSHLPWNSPNGKDKEGPLHLLWKRTPESIHLQDASTGLYPFLLAAASTDANDQQEKEDALQLDTIYILVRLYPQLIHDLTRTMRQ